MNDLIQERERMLSHKTPIARRTLLKALGATLALPLLQGFYSSQTASVVFGECPDTPRPIGYLSDPPCCAAMNGVNKGCRVPQLLSEFSLFEPMNRSAV